MRNAKDMPKKRYGKTSISCGSVNVRQTVLKYGMACSLILAVALPTITSSVKVVVYRICSYRLEEFCEEHTFTSLSYQSDTPRTKQ